TELVFLIITLLYGLIEGGREIFIYVILILIPYFKTLKNKLVLFLFFPVFLFLITTWKAISIFVFQIGDVEQFSEWFSADLSFTFSSLDPIVSVLLLNNYLDGIKIFDNFYFSYIINTFSQFFAALNIYEYQSISKQIVEYFDPTAYSDGKGFAFSGILESLLNFWYFGPMFLGLICGGILSKIRRFKTDTILSNILAIFFIIIILKLIRTELAVVLKIYLLPMILSYIIIFKKFKIA
ncbi:O-antigen polysaccharide polymerase Wzy, partial [Flavobacteriaceae bacterium]|nr:O-antigen polysaccharide polymerase Wzy [Flavobacteriaceae bacterium]